MDDKHKARMYYVVTCKLSRKGEEAIRKFNLWPKTFNKLKAVPELWIVLTSAWEKVEVLEYKDTNTRGTNESKMSELDMNEFLVQRAITFNFKKEGK